MIEQYKRNPNTVCIVCKKAIYRRPIEMRRNKGNVFCGAMCYGIFCRKEFPCIICGKPILSGLNRKTCSRVCANKNRVGIKYKSGGLKDRVISQRALKIRLLKIRGEKCERCDYNKIEILQTHHKDRNRNNNSLKNLALICPNCHFEEHYLEKSWLRR